MIPPLRFFITDIRNKDNLVDKLSRIALYTLIVSHGIRIDTHLLVRVPFTCICFNGYKLRHLYPQEKSLKGFMNAILYKNKTYPGIMRNCRFSKYIKKNIDIGKSKQG